MENWLRQLIEVLPNGNGYLLIIFLVSLAESIPIVGLIIPGSTIVVLAGFLVLHGKCTLLLLMLVTTAGALLGDLLSFWLGYRYGTKLLKIRSFQKHHSIVKRAEHFFVEHGGKSIFFARFIGPIRGITPFIAGLAGMASKSFSGYTLISAILWGICYPSLGYLGGSSWQHAQSLAAKFGLAIIVIFIATIIHYWIRRNFRNN